jgi:hypothetical protein
VHSCPFAASDEQLLSGLLNFQNTARWINNGTATVIRGTNIYYSPAPLYNPSRAYRVSVVTLLLAHQPFTSAVTQSRCARDVHDTSLSVIINNGVLNVSVPSTAANPFSYMQIRLQNEATGSLFLSSSDMHFVGGGYSAGLVSISHDSHFRVAWRPWCFLGNPSARCVLIVDTMTLAADGRACFRVD